MYVPEALAATVYLNLHLADTVGEPYEMSEIKCELSSTLWQLAFGPGERSHHQQ
jgi:hypothetical protein